MAARPEIVVGMAAEMIAEHAQTMQPDAHHGKIARYLRGDHDLPYMPKGAKGEFKTLAKKSITNWLPLISDTFAKMLFVDGYRPSKATDNSAAWAYWQANGLDARQSVAHRGALDYGASYTLVLPGDKAPLIRPLSPTKVIAWYEDDDDEWAAQGIRRKGRRIDGAALWEVYDSESVHVVAVPKDSNGKPVWVSTNDHGLGVVPLVRFRDRLDGEVRGVIAPLFALQDRINEAVFALLIALQYASFRQRWATGLAIPVDENPTIPVPNPNYKEEEPQTEENFPLIEVPNPNFGKPVETFEAAINRLWVSDNADAHFGDFAQTDVSGHLRAYESAVKTLAAIAQTSPLALLGDLVNLSADALASVEATTTRKSAEYETIMGESWEQTLRLASLAAGDPDGAADTASQVRWRDTEARSLAASVDALGKMVQMLSVPAEAAWERIPGVTDQDIERWRGMASSGDGIAALAEALNRQTAPAATATPTPTA